VSRSPLKRPKPGDVFQKAGERFLHTRTITPALRQLAGYPDAVWYIPEPRTGVTCCLTLAGWRRWSRGATVLRAAD
jgi:hypothetical protein